MQTAHNPFTQVLHLSGHETHVPFMSYRPVLHDVHVVMSDGEQVEHEIIQLLHLLPTGAKPPRQLRQVSLIQDKQFLEHETHVPLAGSYERPGKQEVQALAVPLQVKQLELQALHFEP